MKMIKVDDDIHAKLKQSDQSINKTLRDLVFNAAPAREEPDSLLEQINMRFDYLEQMISIIQVGNLPVQEEASLSLGSETKQQKFLRIKKEAEAQEKARRYAIEHPEECDQTREYM